jgi:DNA-binding MarR family transcriptional regulator
LTHATTANLGYLLAKASQRWNEVLYERFEGEGFAEVRPAYGALLLPLFEQDGLRVGDLGQQAGLAKQSMTTMVRLLERDGLVERRADPQDGRATRIYLTDRARAFQPVAESVLAEMHERVTRLLGVGATRTMQSNLKELMHL